MGETFWPYGVGSGPLDELLARFFRDLPSDGSDLGRMLTDDGIELLRLAVRQAGRWGNPDVDTEHLLWAATHVDGSRALLDHEGFQTGRLARAMEGTGKHHDTLLAWSALVLGTLAGVAFLVAATRPGGTATGEWVAAAICLGVAAVALVDLFVLRYRPRS